MSKSKMINCKHCGAEIAAKAKVCPQCGGKNKPPFYKRGWFIALCAVVIIAVISSAGGSDEPIKVGDISGATSSSTVEQTNQNRFTIGEQVSLKDVVVTLKSVNESSGTSFFKPESGNVFLICEFDISNNSTSEIAISSLLSFEAYVDDYTTSLSFSALAASDKTQLDGAIAAGKKMSGVVGYEVPKNWEELEINFTPDVWVGKDIVFYTTKG